MLRDVDASLSAWVAGMLPAGVAVVFDPPGTHSGKHPTLALYLHAVQEDAEGGSSGWSEMRAGDGRLVARVPPDRRYRLTYLVTAWAADVLAEHELLGQVLAGASMTQVLPEEYLTGALVTDDRPVLAFCAPERSACDPRELWAAWRIAPRTTLELSLLAPLPRTLVTQLPSTPKEIDLASSRQERAPAAGAAVRSAGNGSAGNGSVGNGSVGNGSGHKVPRHRRGIIEEG